MSSSSESGSNSASSSASSGGSYSGSASGSASASGSSASASTSLSSTANAGGKAVAPGDFDDSPAPATQGGIPAPATKKSGGAGRKICGVFCAVWGLIFVIVGIVIFAVMPGLIDSVVEEARVVDSKDHENYGPWASGRDEDSRDVYQSYWAWNMTNEGAVRAGLAAPQFEKLGPYTYKYVTSRIDVEFSENGNEVSYLEQSQYFFDAERSADGVSEDDLVVNFHLLYWPLLRLAGVQSESQLLLGFVPVVIGGYISTLAGALGSQTAALQQWGNTGTPLPGLPQYDFFDTTAGRDTAVDVATAARILFDEDGGLFVCTSLISCPNFVSAMTVAASLATAEPLPLPAVFDGDLALFVAMATYFQQMATVAVVPYVQENFFGADYSGTGAIVRKTANEFIFGKIDPIVQLVDPSLAFFGLQTNHTSDEFTRAIKSPSTTLTGKSDIEDIAQYIVYDGQSEITDYVEPVEVTGTNGLEFAPRVEEDDVLVGFIPEAMRPIRFLYEDEADVKEIETLEYRIDDDMLPKVGNENYRTQFDGVFSIPSGIVGENPFFLPVAVSKIHFLDAQDDVQAAFQAATGDLYPPSRANDDPILYVEPITGVVVKGLLRLQINGVVGEDQASFMDVFHAGIAPGVYPLLSIEREGQISDDDAEDFRGAIYLFQDLAIVILVVGLVLGLAFIAIGVYLIRKPSPASVSADDVENK